MPPAICIENLSKTYRIGTRTGEPYQTLRESIVRGVGDTCARIGHALGLTNGRGRPNGEGSESSIHRALDDVSLDIEPGEILGLVGRNGAGKSTLLKILSQITEPTSGRAVVRGRLGSLLEVGTGFHQELTGRENVYLNGSILGMPRREIDRKFDEIVDFAEIGKFLDTPVKRYSSGMFVRLGFAVAAHFEPEILIVDEVLAVGDVAFQKKCLGKMDDVSRKGRTILFVSHNMAAIKSLCTRAVLLESGIVRRDGDVNEVVNEYLALGQPACRDGEIPEGAERMGTGVVRMLRVRVTDETGQDREQLCYGEPFRVSFECEVYEHLEDVLFEVSISALDGTHVMKALSCDWGGRTLALSPGRHEISASFDNVLLPRGYTVGLGCHRLQDGTTHDYVARTIDFTVLSVGENVEDHHPWPLVRGYVRPRADWDFVA